MLCVLKYIFNNNFFINLITKEWRYIPSQSFSYQFPKTQHKKTQHRYYDSTRGCHCTSSYTARPPPSNVKLLLTLYRLTKREGNLPLDDLPSLSHSIHKHTSISSTIFLALLSLPTVSLTLS